jgi:hypothetical protein
LQGTLDVRKGHAEIADDAMLADRIQVVRRSLRALPDRLVSALARGLARHEDELVVGHLYGYSGGGGCAVGVMLRELRPERYRVGRLRFWLRHGWRVHASSYRGAVEGSPRLAHLEWTFDAAVQRLRQLDPGLGPRAAARVVGGWFRAEAEAELGWRALRAAALGPSAGPPATSEVAVS